MFWNGAIWEPNFLSCCIFICCGKHLALALHPLGLGEIGGLAGAFVASSQNLRAGLEFGIRLNSGKGPTNSKTMSQHDLNSVD